MLVKLPDEDVEFVERLKQLTGEKTAAKAYKHAANQFPFVLHNLFSADVEIEKLKEEVFRLQSVIEGARSAAALLLDRTSQIDLDLSAGH